MANEDELLQMHNLKPAPGARKDRTRVGRCLLYTSDAADE